MQGRSGFLGFVFSLALGLCGPAAQAADPGVTDSEIKIGVHLALTGPASFVGQGAKVGIDAAVAEINKNGGVNGRKLSIVYADDRGAPDGGVTAGRRLVDEEKVFFVFGTGTSTTTISVLPFFQQNSVPYFVAFASDPRVLEKFMPHIYVGGTISQLDGTKSYTRFLQNELKAKKVAMMQCDQAHCTSGGPLLKRILEEAGMTVFLTNFNSGDTDFTGQIQQVKSFGPDVVFVYGLAADGGRIFPQVRRAGITVPLVGDTSLADLAVAKLAGTAAEGYYTFWLGGRQFLNDKTGAMGKFLASLDANKIERPGNTPNLYTLMAYADVYVVAEALRGAGKDLTRAGLIKSLDTNIRDFVGGASAPWTFAAPLGLPRSYSPTDHQGNRKVQPVVYRGGEFKAVGD